MATYPLSSIETIGLRGIKFRSILEARWAHFFDVLGITWDYEPFSLQNYIPDFIIRLPRSDKEILIEVKGETYFGNLKKYHDKIINSGWKGPYIIVGCKLFSVEDVINSKEKDEYCESASHWVYNGCSEDVPVVGLLGDWNSGWCDDEGPWDFKKHRCPIYLWLSERKQHGEDLTFAFSVNGWYADIRSYSYECNPDVYSHYGGYHNNEIMRIWYEIQNKYQYKSKKWKSNSQKYYQNDIVLKREHHSSSIKLDPREYYLENYLTESKTFIETDSEEDEELEEKRKRHHFEGYYKEVVLDELLRIFVEKDYDEYIEYYRYHLKQYCIENIVEVVLGKLNKNIKSKHRVE